MCKNEYIKLDMNTFINLIKNKISSNKNNYGINLMALNT